ncbi:MAG: acyl-ACP--UDP-N-acetylglucosamine O-acyltransferase [Terrimicrobiaceae bacterium]|nr:acyl-ACP--UDP-N-acetylglucosamine O-acyltransferase [Terrimicrobiaceae bacterium]
MIHSSALVSPSAELAEDVEIGPGAVIGDNVRIGRGTVIQAHAVLEQDVTLGEGNVVGYGCVIGAAPQDFAHTADVKSDVRIGDRNRFREYVTIHRGTKDGTSTVVGNGCFLMVGAHLAHNVRLGDGVIITNNCLLAGYVEIGDHTVLGGGSVFHQFVRVGHRAMVAGQSAFNKDIPPFAMANFRNILVGLNRIGLKRAGFGPDVRKEIDSAYRLLFRSGKTMRDALAEATQGTWTPETRSIFDFIAASKRGVIQMRKAGAADESDPEV